MFNSISAIFEWMPDEGGHNFGDYLMQLIGEGIFLPDEWSRLQQSSCCKFVLLGSFICDFNLNLVAEQEKHPVIVGCGYRGEVLSPKLTSESTFLGCRGKFSQAALSDVGVDVDWVGDPAVVLPLLIREKRASRRSIFMPHINDPLRRDIAPSDVGCDQILQPEIADMEHLIETVREISGASFVLAGAMHAAVVAYAYGVPFAFYATNGGYRDCPPKWADWLSSISRPYVPPAFFSSASGGMSWYRQNQHRFQPPKYVPILNQYAAVGRLRRSIIVKATLHDAWQMYKFLVNAKPLSFSARFVKQRPENPLGQIVIESGSDLLVSRNSRKPRHTNDEL